MQKAFDLTEVRLLLRRGINSGHWTLEDLDTPSMGWKENAERFRRDYPLYVQPTYRNPLRDDDVPASVQPTSPRDFSPPIGPTPAHTQPLPITLHDDPDDLPVF